MYIDIDITATHNHYTHVPQKEEEMIPQPSYPFTAQKEEGMMNSKPSHGDIWSLPSYPTKASMMDCFTSEILTDPFRIDHLLMVCVSLCV
jgi:hypothetical protein